MRNLFVVLGLFEPDGESVDESESVIDFGEPVPWLPLTFTVL